MVQSNMSAGPCAQRTSCAQNLTILIWTKSFCLLNFK